MHKSPVEVLIPESSPVSTAESIEVKSTFEPKPTVENWENKRGIKAWERALPAPAQLSK